MDNSYIEELIKSEGWKFVSKNGKKAVEVYGEIFPVCHPFAIHSKLYRDSENPDVKYQHFVSMHDYLWPETKKNLQWHYWTERRFHTHCEGWNFISYAGGASTAKSNDAAKIALLFWLADPKNRAVIVASTTLESLNSRIWGYVTRFLHDMKVDLPYVHRRGAPPKILYDKKDTIHGMFAIAAKQGSDDSAIASWIGRHPNKALLLILDEGTDMPPAILNAIPNLSAGGIEFQLMVIGNSSSKFDLHGSLSTPKAGWKSIDPMIHNRWETTQKNGVCLFFSCYESPAIHEPNPVKKAQLSKFLITQEQIDAKKKVYGSTSDSFYRFVLGFWREESTEETVISRKFLDQFNVHPDGVYTECSRFFRRLIAREKRKTATIKAHRVISQKETGNLPN